jgi:hypothetical protein
MPERTLLADIDIYIAERSLKGVRDGEAFSMSASSTDIMLANDAILGVERCLQGNRIAVAS